MSTILSREQIITGLEILIEKLRQAERDTYVLSPLERLMVVELNGWFVGWKAAMKKQREGELADRWTGLTQAQMRVVDLALAGRSNSEISRKLFLTKSTVEQHLTAVYKRLGVHNRAGLREAAESRKRED